MTSHRKNHRRISISLLVIFLTAGFTAPLHAQDGEAYREILKRIVGQEKYTYTAFELPPPSSGEDSLIERINLFLEKLWNKITEAFKKAPWLAMALSILVTCLVIIIAVLIVRRLDFSRGKAKSNTRGAVTEEFNMDFQREIKSAKELAGRGENKHAVSTAVNALWLYLHYKGVIRYMKSTTNREYLSDMDDTDTFPRVPEIIRDSETAVYAESSMSDEQRDEILSSIIAVTAQ